MRKINFRNKKLGEKSISIFEIFLLTISIVAFAYFVGNEFQFVGAVGAGVVGEGGAAAATTTTTTGSEVAAIAMTSSPAATTTLSEAVAGASAGGAPAAASAGTEAAASAGSLGSDPAFHIAEAAKLAAQKAGANPTWTWPKNLGDFANRLWGYAGDILWNAAIAAVLYVGIRAIFEWSGWCPTCDPELAEAWATALAIGYGAGAGFGIILAALGGNAAFGLPILTLVGAGWGLIGLGVAFLYMAIFYRESFIVAVQYNCYPWKPNTGGADCDLCNNRDFDCTKYKCQSLGQSCELLNPGKKTQVCAWKDRNDASPPEIKAWLEPLTEGFEYIPITTEMGDRGVEIRNKTGNPCLLPFKRLDYGINLTKPGQCRIDYIRKKSFNDMTIPGLISDGDWLEEHYLFSLHGGIEAANEAGLIRLPNGGNVEIYVKCISRNNVATGTFVFKYCVDDEPDITPPIIKLTDPPNGAPIQFGQTSREVKVYVDKPSDCKWSHNDEDYATMPENQKMVCSLNQGSNTYFKCLTNLTSLKDGVENKFYFNCESYPTKEGTAKESERRTMATNYPYRLIGTRPLVIDSVSPESGAVIKDSTQSVKVTLKAITSAGYNNGAAWCWYKKKTDADNRYVLFANTQSYQSTQELWFSRESYRYTVKCCDLGNNCATKETDFSVDTDFVSPIVVRAYSEGSSLKIITDEKAECVYDTTSCSYTFEDGIKMVSSDNIAHTTEWNTNSNFYIKCKDEFGVQPAPDGCSITVRPFNSY